MIKVLHILQDINSGGVERRRLSIAKRINTSEFELKIICINAKNDIPELIKNCGVEVIELKTYSGPFDWSTHKKVQKIISDYKPDIIHGAVFEGVTLAAVNGFIKRVPHIIIEETSDPIRRSWRGHLLMKLFSSLSHYVVGVSQASTNYLQHKINLPKHKVKLIQNGVKSAKTYSDEVLVELKKQYNITNNDFVFVSAGRMNTEYPKNFSFLIRAFANVAQTNNNAKLILIGDGNMLDEYKKLAVELNVANQIIFPGYQGEVDKFFAISNVFCLFSVSESFGLAAVEAQMNKIPAIVSQVGGLQYTVVTNKSGFVVPSNDLDAATNAMLYAINNPEKMIEMGNFAFEYVNQNFHENHYVDNLFNFYRDILK
jgi:L-malate glycosyltransferase